MKDFIQGYNRCVFRYIKDIVDHIEKSGDAIDTSAVICGIIVITNVYLMSILYQCSSIYAITMANKAIGIYIDFMIQMNNIDNSSSSSLKLSYLDAGQFVYKKIFSNTTTIKDSSLMHPSVDLQLDTKNDAESSNNNNNIVVYVDTTHIFEILHQHNVFIRNITNVLFKLPVFYNEKSETIEYYSLVINKMLYVNNIIENIPVLSLEKTYCCLITMQRSFCEKSLSIHNDTEKLYQYMSAIEDIILQNTST
jgi:hypothetical protein